MILNIQQISPPKCHQSLLFFFIFVYIIYYDIAIYQSQLLSYQFTKCYVIKFVVSLTFYKTISLVYVYSGNFEMVSNMKLTPCNVHHVFDKMSHLCISLSQLHGLCLLFSFHWSSSSSFFCFCFVLFFVLFCFLFRFIYLFIYFVSCAFRHTRPSIIGIFSTLELSSKQTKLQH